MVATIPPMLVEKPTPFFARYGLFQAANGPLDLPVHARNGGLRYVTGLCGDGYSYEIECLASQNSKAASFNDNGTDTVTGAPFIVYTTLECGTVGYSFEEMRALTFERLRSIEQSQVEIVFSTGAVAAVPALLATSGIQTLAGAGDSAVNVVSELERAMYCTTKYGPQAFLHMAIPVFNQLKSDHLIEFDGTRWRTPLGTIVSTGCYANNDPAGVAPADGVFWIYITGQTTVWRTSDENVQIAPVEGSLNRTTNQFMMLAEREYVVTYECAGWAKPVTLWT